MQNINNFADKIKKVIDSVLKNIFTIICHLLQLTVVILIAIANKRLLECIIIYISMCFTRNIFSMGEWHAKSFLVCTAVTWSVFHFLTSAVPPIWISYFTAPAFGIGISFIMAHLGNYIKLLSKCNFKIEKNCDENGLREMCKTYGMTPYEENLLVRKYVYSDTDAKLQKDFHKTNIRREISKIRQNYKV